jgi:anthranilate phosphoribosyltransferase
VTDTMKAGVDKARAAIESGAAKAKLAQLVAASQATA